MDENVRNFKPRVSLCFRLKAATKSASYQLSSEVDYAPIQSTSWSHGLMVINPNVAGLGLHELQLMHHGSTVIRWDSKDGESISCFFRLESDNETLTWTAPTWSSLQDTTVPDYEIGADHERQSLDVLCGKFSSGLPVDDDMGEGFIDLSIVKEIRLGYTTADLTLIQKQHSLVNLSADKHCMCLFYGVGLADNRRLEFILPSFIAEKWCEGLKKLVNAARNQALCLADQRESWLKRKYLQLYYEDGRMHGPTPAEAVQVHVIFTISPKHKQ